MPDRSLPPAGPVRVDVDRSWALHDVDAARTLEERARAVLAPGTLMHRAGRSVARLARALAPHARNAWVAAGPGGNGGDGLHAAAELRAAGLEVRVTWLASAGVQPAESAQALQRAREAGCRIGPELAHGGADLAIDALLGLGASRPPGEAMRAALQTFNGSTGLRLCVDLPSGLRADTGERLGAETARGHATLSLLTLKPALFTGAGREQAGQVWFDDLGVRPDLDTPPIAWLASARDVAQALGRRGHDSHKGRYGDVLIVGGAPGMVGAARLAAIGACAAGPGRVFLSLLDDRQPLLDPVHPEWLWTPQAWLQGRHALEAGTAVCGCGGGLELGPVLQGLLARAGRLVLDADALNAVARDETLRRQVVARRMRGLPTVITPHPLEAARLLGCDTARVQADRLRAAQALARDLGSVVLLKGSGSVIAGEGQPTMVNPTGSASLAVGGTGDVLAGWIGGLWAASAGVDAGDANALARRCALAAAWLHGRAGERPHASPVQASTLGPAMAALAERLRDETDGSELSDGSACGA